jgi:hypothetical protein
MCTTIGILGGMGPHATIDLFKKIIDHTSAGVDQEHVKIIIYNNPKIPPRTLLHNPLPANAAHRHTIAITGSTGKTTTREFISSAVLGSMLELGEYTRKGHEEIGQYLARKRFDAIYSYGQEAQSISKGAIQAGLPPNKTTHYTDRNELHKALKTHLGPNCAILVKGLKWI